MEVLAVILLLVVIYLMNTAKNDLTNKINELDFRIITLQELLKKSDQTTIQPVEPPVVEKQPAKPVEPPVVEKQPAKPVEEQKAVDIVPEPIVPPVAVQQEETLKELEPIAVPAKKILSPSPTLIENPRLSFFER